MITINSTLVPPDSGCVFIVGENHRTLDNHSHMDRGKAGSLFEVSREEAGIAMMRCAPMFFVRRIRKIRTVDVRRRVY